MLYIYIIIYNMSITASHMLLVSFAGCTWFLSKMFQLNYEVHNRRIFKFQKKESNLEGDFFFSLFVFL